MAKMINKVRLIKFIRLYPLLAIAILLIAYLLGAFSDQNDPIIDQQYLITALYLFIVVVPVAVIIAFLIIGKSSDNLFKQVKSDEIKFANQDPFNLPKVKMGGYKLALLTNRPPEFTGLTGDTYQADAAALCNLNPNHTPPVAQCECGFYAYKDKGEARFEASINPGAFLIAVDLYGVGFEYERGWRSESQVVKALYLPKRCMRCRVLTPKVFVTTFKLGYGTSNWWQWQVRCGICSSSFKSEDKLSFNQLAQQLKVEIR